MALYKKFIQRNSSEVFRDSSVFHTDVAVWNTSNRDFCVYNIESGTLETLKYIDCIDSYKITVITVPQFEIPECVDIYPFYKKKIEECSEYTLSVESYGISPCEWKNIYVYTFQNLKKCVDNRECIIQLNVPTSENQIVDFVPSENPPLTLSQLRETVCNLFDNCKEKQIILDYISGWDENDILKFNRKIVLDERDENLQEALVLLYGAIYPPELFHPNMAKIEELYKKDVDSIYSMRLMEVQALYHAHREDTILGELLQACVTMEEDYIDVAYRK